MLRAIDNFFYDKPEPTNSCLNALRSLVLQSDPDLIEVWTYSMPFYKYRGKRICYIWVKKKTGHPYLGIVNGNVLDHTALIAERRSKIKALPLHPGQDLPVETIREVLEIAIKLGKPIIQLELKIR